jgi:hypothetical protein
MGEFYGIGSCSDGVCKCCPVDGMWIFLITLISFIAVGVIGRVHRSVVGSLIPFKITLFLYFTSHFVSVKISLHPALHITRMPMSEAIDNPGTICPVSGQDHWETGMLMSHIMSVE